eukprot:CAMPEP_0169161036 /NCGR_PEP_ID=MMETSP1015-20121227/56808_1 /TAXON_ID=342587 /ORGANISM="Karlodinium micrum, Strain CCMP2283" /LENGTH=144 /DNA_ID=CAMNT_0009232821 /DNA_START=155 /DNA_END=585 /DNA_ORIENTATION=+
MGLPFWDGSILRAQATALEHTISEVKAHIEEGRISLDGGMDQIFANVIQDDVAAQDMLMAKMGKIVGGKEEIAEIQGDAIAIETQMEEDAVAKAIAQTNGGFFLQQKRTEPRFEASAILQFRVSCKSYFFVCSLCRSISFVSRG